MLRLIHTLWRVFEISAVLTIVLGALGAVYFFGSGRLDIHRIRPAFRILRGEEPPVKIVERPPETEWMEYQAHREERDAALREREADLERLHDITTTRLAMMKQEREGLDQDRAAVEKMRREAQERQETVAKTRASDDFKINLAIFAKADPQMVAGVLGDIAGGDPEVVIQYLQALKPAKAAEVIDALRADDRVKPDTMKEILFRIPKKPS